MVWHARRACPFVLSISWLACIKDFQGLLDAETLTYGPADDDADMAARELGTLNDNAGGLPAESPPPKL